MFGHNSERGTRSCEIVLREAMKMFIVTMCLVIEENNSIFANKCEVRQGAYRCPLSFIVLLCGSLLKNYTWMLNSGKSWSCIYWSRHLISILDSINMVNLANQHSGVKWTLHLEMNLSILNLIFQYFTHIYICDWEFIHFLSNVLLKYILCWIIRKHFEQPCRLCFLKMFMYSFWMMEHTRKNICIWFETVHNKFICVVFYTSRNIFIIAP